MGITASTIPSDLEKVEKGNKDKLDMGFVDSNNAEDGLASGNGNGSDEKAGSGSDTEGEGEITMVKIPLRERIHRFTFDWYTLTMSTGGIALLMSLLPHRFRGLTEIGTTIFFIDLILQTIITILLVTRFLLFPTALYSALAKPPESIFVGTFMLSLAVMLSNIQEYGIPNTGPWLPIALRICFWTYLAVVFLLSIWQYDRLFRYRKHLAPSTMTPAWILPIFPVMLAGTLAGFFAPSQPEGHALAIVAAGAAAQGLGMLVSLCFCGTYLARLMGYGLPDQRPGMFIAVGPPSFTAAALVSMGADVPRIMAVEDLASIPVIGKLGLTNPVLVGEAFRLGCVGSAVFFWGLSFWFCLLAIAGSWDMPDKKFRLNWWSFVFPNVGFTIATLRIGDAMGSEGVMWLGICMAGVLTVVWAVVMVMCVKAVVRREIL